MAQLDLFEDTRKTYRGFVPRDYQRRAIENTFGHFNAGIPGVIVRTPTGSGKTLTASFVAHEWLSKGPLRRVLVLAHERQLIWQFSQELHDVFGVRPGIEMADEVVTDLQHNKIIVASRATLIEKLAGGEVSSRLYKFDRDKYEWLLIIDELHRWSYGLPSCAHILKWFEENPASRRLGITATPQRTDNRSLGKICPAIGLDYPLYDLSGGPSAVRDGWAVPYDQRFVVVHSVNFSNLGEVAKDFTDEELDRVLNTQQQIARIVDPMLDLVGDRRTLIFNPSVAMAKEVARYIVARRGAAVAESLDGAVRESIRKDTYKRHQQGAFQFLSVCGLCREGYNDPGIAAVAIFRPTKSRSLAEQMKGRGVRPLRGLVDGLESAQERVSAIASSAKPDCMIVDLVGVTGMADMASTAHILGAGKPDEVIAKANKNMSEAIAAGTVKFDVVAEIAKAEEDLEAERKLAKKKRDEREKAAQADADRRAKLKAEVEYTARQVEQGLGGHVVRHNGKLIVLASVKQKSYLKFNNIPFNEGLLTVAWASRMIDMHKKGASVDEIIKKVGPVAGKKKPEPKVIQSKDVDLFSDLEG